jgi:hypothetical protein
MIQRRRQRHECGQLTGVTERLQGKSLASKHELIEFVVGAPRKRVRIGVDFEVDVDRLRLAGL